MTQRPGRRVAIIDDSEVALAFTASILERDGFFVVAINTPIGASTRLLETIPDLALVDRNRPLCRESASSAASAACSGSAMCPWSSTPTTRTNWARRSRLAGPAASFERPKTQPRSFTPSKRGCLDERFHRSARARYGDPDRRHAAAVDAPHPSRTEPRDTDPVPPATSRPSASSASEPTRKLSILFCRRI